MSTQTLQALRWSRWMPAAYVTAALLAAPWGWDVGVRIAGPLVGAVMALNCAVLGTLAVGAVVDGMLRLQQWRSRR